MLSFYVTAIPSLLFEYDISFACIHSILHNLAREDETDAFIRHDNAELLFRYVSFTFTKKQDVFHG